MMKLFQFWIRMFEIRIKQCIYSIDHLNWKLLFFRFFPHFTHLLHSPMNGGNISILDKNEQIDNEIFFFGKIEFDLDASESN